MAGRRAAGRDGGGCGWTLHGAERTDQLALGEDADVWWFQHLHVDLHCGPCDT